MDEIAKHFGNYVTEKRLAELAGMTVEQWKAMREREPVVIPGADDAA